jgi:hypothetical protein
LFFFSAYLRRFNFMLSVVFTPVDTQDNYTIYQTTNGLIVNWPINNVATEICSTQLTLIICLFYFRRYYCFLLSIISIHIFLSVYPCSYLSVPAHDPSRKNPYWLCNFFRNAAVCNFVAWADRAVCCQLQFSAERIIISWRHRPLSFYRCRRRRRRRRS